MERADDIRLQELRDKGVPIYSISRLGTINGCLYEAYRTYVLGEKGIDNIYCMLGSKLHDTLELIVNNEATEADLYPALMSELEDMDMMGIEFPKGRDGSDSIRESWCKDMIHFCETYKSPKGKKLETERLFIYETPKHHYMQGFIDLTMVNPDGSISIYDYKTSSYYTKEGFEEHKMQLLTYALGKIQEGYKVHSAAWIFLKYLDVTYMGKKTSRSKNKELITKTIERRKFGEEMAEVIRNDMLENGIDEFEVEMLVEDVKRTNLLTKLPKNIQKLYKVKPCVVETPINEETLQECIDYIDDTIDMWEGLDSSSARDYKPRKFEKVLKSGKVVSDCFYCSTLCQHRKACPYLRDYLDMHSLDEEKKNKDKELFE